MLKVGITGGIGSGKSWVCRIFKHLGIPLFEADAEMKKLYVSDTELIDQLIQHFGVEAYNEDGVFNTEFFRQVLKDPKQRERLNAITHPKIFERFQVWASEQNAPYVIKEAAILFESGANKTVDVSVGVFAPLETRISRVMSRDRRSREDILKIMDMQLPESELRKKVDFHIENDSEQSVILQVRNLHQRLLNKAAHF